MVTLPQSRRSRPRRVTGITHLSHFDQKPPVFALVLGD
ncbi:Uncharacterized protein ChrSV_2947 [Chromobacterium vaccinii]|nr:Uncharacterized protein ChrSW_2947 [Chromobacterium vaccinii]QND90404.1 Uncharacterized protein ChrSV_2947 [Chromobacterium vaccinii]